jgi:branched-chain amino acid transport system ATP-binding protein
VIEVRDVSAGFGPIQVLHQVTLTVPAGGIVTLVGANGAGKTTLLRTISGLVRPTSGSILFDGRPTAGVAPHMLARTGLVHVPQGRQIVPTLTVRENLELGAERVAQGPRTDMASDLEREFERFPVLKARQSILGGNLSGGEQQMLAVSRGLMMRPKVLILDEPSLGLAPQIVRIILDALRRLADDGLAVLLIEQLAMLALDIADYAYVLQRGRIVISGQAAQVKRDPAVIESYLH